MSESGRGQQWLRPQSQEDKGGRAHRSLRSSVCGSMDSFLFHCETNAILGEHGEVVRTSAPSPASDSGKKELDHYQEAEGILALIGMSVVVATL